jgi:hypothetical protein
MITIKNRYQKVLFRLKNGEVKNSSGAVMAKVGDGVLLNRNDEPLYKIEGTDVLSLEDDSPVAQLSGTKVLSPDGDVLGYVDGKPFNQFIYAAAALYHLVY